MFAIITWFIALILIGLVLLVLGIKRMVTDMRSTKHLAPPSRMLKHVITEHGAASLRATETKLLRLSSMEH